MYRKASPNFFFYEFRPNGATLDWLPQSLYQEYLITLLSNNLEILKGYVNGMSLNITCGIRTANDYKRLMDAGYHPAQTSDHYYGSPITIDQTSAKYPIFGPSYNFSVGAADIVPKGISIVDFFNLAVSKVKSGDCKFGQVIHEYDFNTGRDWVHFANDPSIIFGSKIVQLLNHPKFLTSSDGGKTYIEVA